MFTVWQKTTVQAKKKIKKQQLFYLLSLIGTRNYEKEYKIYFLYLLRALVVADLADYS